MFVGAALSDDALMKQVLVVLSAGAALSDDALMKQVLVVLSAGAALSDDALVKQVLGMLSAGATLSDDALVKQLLLVLLEVSAQHGNVASLLTELARHVHIHIGDIDQVSVDVQDKHAV